MLRDTSAARTSSRSVDWARAPPVKSNKTRKSATERADRIGDVLVIGGEDRPTGSAAEECRQRTAGTPYLWTERNDDAHRPDPLIDRHCASRDQGNHRRDRPLGRAPAH